MADELEKGTPTTMDAYMAAHEREGRSGCLLRGIVFRIWEEVLGGLGEVMGLIGFRNGMGVGLWVRDFIILPGSGPRGAGFGVESRVGDLGVILGGFR